MGLIRRTAMSNAIRASSQRTWLGHGGLRSCVTVKTPSEDEEEKKKEITIAEAKKLMRLVNVEDMKKKLVGVADRDVVSYSTLLEASQGMGIARSPDEAHVFARVLDDAGVVLIFRDKVYLHPDKVLIRTQKQNFTLFCLTLLCFVSISLKIWTFFVLFRWWI
jgi:hypothetical protein